MESVLKRYWEGTLSRLEVFGILEIPLAEEAAFAEYCQKNLSDKFVFSDAEDGDFKSYGQGVAIKDKLLPFFPKEGKAAEKLKEELAQWEVTEAELDGGMVQVVCSSEKHSFSSSQQMEKGEDLYQRVYQTLRIYMEVPKYQPKVTVAIGKRGPGGGIVFHIDGPKAYEVSEVLGRHTWEEAKRVAAGYRGGSFDDWRLPTKEEMDLVYQNLRNPRIITGDDWHWSSSQCQYYSHCYWALCFGDCGQDYYSKYLAFAVRAIRSFNVGSAPTSSTESAAVRAGRAFVQSLHSKIESGLAASSAWK